MYKWPFCEEGKKRKEEEKCESGTRRKTRRIVIRYSFIAPFVLSLYETEFFIGVESALFLLYCCRSILSRLYINYIYIYTLLLD